MLREQSKDFSAKEICPFETVIYIYTFSEVKMNISEIQ